MVSTLGMTNALTKLPIEGVITDAEFQQKFVGGPSVYQRILNPKRSKGNWTGNVTSR